MIQAKQACICRFPVFCDLHESTVAALLGRGRQRKIPKQESLFNEGETPEFVHIVVDGVVAVVGRHRGEEIVFNIVEPGTIVVLAAVIRNSVYLGSARTLTASQVMAFPAQDLREFCERDPAVARVMLHELADRCRNSVRSFKNMTLRNSAERLANWILQTYIGQKKGAHIELIYDKRTLASRLGMTPENLSRNLALLAKHGVRSSGRDIVVENPFTLARFAKPNALIDG